MVSICIYDACIDSDFVIVTDIIDDVILKLILIF